MTTLDFDATSLSAAPREAAALRAVNWIVATYNALKNRRAFYRLSDLSDLELQDIGLTRGDLTVAVALGTDPTRYLGAIAQTRREGVEPFPMPRV